MPQIISEHFQRHSGPSRSTRTMNQLQSLNRQTHASQAGGWPLPSRRWVAAVCSKGKVSLKLARRSSNSANPARITSLSWTTRSTWETTKSRHWSRTQSIRLRLPQEQSRRGIKQQGPWDSFPRRVWPLNSKVWVIISPRYRVEARPKSGQSSRRLKICLSVNLSNRSFRRPIQIQA